MPDPPSAANDLALAIRPAETPAERELAFEIRRRVFVEGQDCPEEEEFDGLDHACRHVLGQLGDRPVATARWRVVSWEGEPAAKLERFAVLESQRGLGFGARLVEHLLAAAEEAGLGTVILHAQVHLERFYGGFGFERRGEEFLEADIPHVLMVRRRRPDAAGSGSGQEG